MSKVLVMDSNLANKIAAGEVVEKTKGVGIELKPINKETFFEYIAKNGPLPRKTLAIRQSV